RGQAGPDRPAVHADGGPDSDRNRDLQQVRVSLDLQSGAAGILGDPLRLHLAGEQQRLGACRLYRLRPPARSGQCRLLRNHIRRHPRWPLDADGALRPAALGAGHLGVAFDEARRSGRTGHLPDGQPPLRNPPSLGDRDRRRAHLLPRPPRRPGGPGPDQPALLMRRDLTASIVAAVAFTLLFGLAYPLLATGVSQVLFPSKSDGSQVKVDGKTVGSSLIGQSFTIRHPIPPDQRGKFGKKHSTTPDAKYFQPRPSASTYSPDVTFFNNLGPNNRKLMQEFNGFIHAYLALERTYHPRLTRRDIPVDAVTTSASGVDPDISQANARIQEHRISKAR